LTITQLSNTISLMPTTKETLPRIGNKEIPQQYKAFEDDDSYILVDGPLRISIFKLYGVWYGIVSIDGQKIINEEAKTRDSVCQKTEKQLKYLAKLFTKYTVKE